MATSLRKRFQKSKKDKKVKKRHRRSLYSFLCGGLNEEDRETENEPIDKESKQKTENMGLAESKSLLSGSASIVAVAKKQDSDIEDKAMKSKSMEKKEFNEKETGLDTVDSGTHRDVASSDVDANNENVNTDKNENMDKSRNIEISDKSAEGLTETIHTETRKENAATETETTKKSDGKDVDKVESEDNIHANGTDSSSSESDSSDSVSDEDKDDKIDKKRKKKLRKSEKNKKMDSTKKEKDSDDAEVNPDQEKEKNGENSEEKDQTPMKPKRNSGKNPLVRIQSKILDALSHQNFDSYTPAICIDFLKSPNLKLLSSLNKKLKRNNKEWNEEFLELHGTDALLDLVDTLGFKRVTQLSDALLLLESVECIKTLMNSKMGLQYLVQHGDYLKKLVKGKSCFRHLVNQLRKVDTPARGTTLSKCFAILVIWSLL